MDTELICQLEQAAANAWPASEVLELDGWRLRFHRGVTRRANSVWPNHNGGTILLDEKLDRVERFYADHGVPARFQIYAAARPAELDGILQSRGYRIEARTFVQIANIAKVLGGAQAKPEHEVELADRVSDVWLEAYGAVEEAQAADLKARREILERIAPRTAYALLRREKSPIAVGLGVLEAGWLGIFCMATLPHSRRTGAATAIVRSLARWGSENGARQGYLQVMEQNAPALALYSRLGFTTLYPYYYRTRE